jgi:hypothetical protein
MFVLVSSLLLVLGLVGSGHAQAGPKPKVQLPPYAPAADITAVNACVREVRQGAGQARFEAHIGPRGDLRSNGTEQELRAFKQCMQQKDSPIPN